MHAIFALPRIVNEGLKSATQAFSTLEDQIACSPSLIPNLKGISQGMQTTPFPPSTSLKPQGARSLYK